MGRGRKPLPTAIKKKKGTARKDRVLVNEMSPRPVKNIPSPPETLDEIGKNEWYRLVAELSRLKVLSHLDLSLIEAYCNEYSTYIEMHKLLKKGGRVIAYKDANGRTTQVQTAPQQRIADRALEKMLKIASEFGFTPSARTRISTNQIQQTQIDEHPLIKALPNR